MMRVLPIGLLLATSAVGVPAQTISFVNVNVVRLGPGDILPSQTVVVVGGRVAAVGPVDPNSPAPGVTIDGAGRYLAPGLVVLDAHLPSDNWLDWREALLVYLAHGVTTVGVSEAEIAMLDSARAEGADAWPRPVLAKVNALDSLRGATDPVQVASHASGLSLPSLEGDPLAALRRHALDLSRSPIRVSGIEPGAPANLLLLAQDPLRDPTAISRPLGVMAQGRWMPYADLVAVAREFGRARRLWYAGRVPRTLATRRSPPWPDSCVGETPDDCFGGDAECGLRGILGLRNHLDDCGVPSARADRVAVLGALDLVSLVDPTDDWIIGQRVHFALMIGDPDRAWSAAEPCVAAIWWCQALRGWVLHERAPGSGHSQFDSAFANAPDHTPAWSSPRIPEAGDRGLHCEWSDLAYLIDDPEVLASYQTEECGSNTAFEARFWWLADPLWSQEGNERRGEHISRNVRMRIRDDYLRVAYRNQNHAHCIKSMVRPIDPISLQVGRYRDPVFHECTQGHSAIIPFGLPNSWRGVAYRLEADVVVGAKGRIVTPPNDRERGWWVSAPGASHFTMYSGDRTYSQLRVGYLNGGYSFVPDAGRFLDPMASAANDWAVTWNEGHERMLTRETWYNLEHQTAVLRRGAELEMLAAARFPELLSSFDGIEGFLAAGRVTDRHIEVGPAEVDRSTGVIRARASLPDDEWLASIEVLGPEVRGRARHGAPAPPLIDGYGISVPVLVRPDFDPGQGALLQAMLPSKLIVQEDRVGLYFELYGVEAGQDVELTLAHDALEGRPSFLGRIASWIGIGGRGSDRNARLRWTERTAEFEDGIAHAFVALDLRDIGAGKHRITVTASTGGRTASGVTDIDIRR